MTRHYAGYSPGWIKAKIPEASNIWKYAAGWCGTSSGRTAGWPMIGSAATLADVVDFYITRFNLNLTPAAEIGSGGVFEFLVIRNHNHPGRVQPP